MSNATMILTVGTFDCNDGTHTFLQSLELGVPNRSAPVFSGPQFDLARTGAMDTSELVETQFSVQITDSTVDGVGDRIATLAAALRDLSDITVGLKGSDNTGTVKPRITSPPAVRSGSPYDSLWMNKYKAVVDVTLLREPWVYGAEVTLHNATATYVPGVLDLAAMTGLAAGPLTVEFNATATNLHQVVAGVYGTDSATVGTFIRQANDLTWTPSLSKTLNANGYGGYRASTLDADPGGWADIDVTSLTPGSYYVFANACISDAAGSGTVSTPYTETVTVTGTSYRRYPLGIVALPPTAVRGSETSNLRVTICGDDTYYIHLNTIEFVPITAGGLVGWHHTTPTSAVDKLRWEDDVVYADDVASHGYAVGGRRLMANGGTVFVTGEGAAQASGVAVTATVTYRPRWETYIP